MAIPLFDVVPIIQNRDGIRIGIVTVSGVSTAHDSADTDNGKLYADVISAGGGTYNLDLYSDYSRDSLTKVASGVAPLIGMYFALTEANDSGITGRARLEGVGETAPAIIIVSFAVDVDIYKDQGDAANLPGYSDVYGLAAFHSAAMRRILTSDLPSAVPDLYRGLNLSAFAPLNVGAELPDISKIQAPDSLRDAQANLVKSLSAQESEHLEEFADIADAARERFVTALATLKAANAPAAEDKKSNANVISFGEFSRV